MHFRRILGAFVASAALTFAPATAAVAYEDVDEGLVVSDTNPEPGEPFEVVVEAGVESPEATLAVTSEDPSVGDDTIEIAGSQSMTKETAAGAATFTVTLHVEGTYSLVGTDASGEVVGEATVVVGDGTAGDEDGGDTDEAEGGASPTSPTGGLLPDTGADTTTTLLAVGGGLLLLGGAVVLLLARRRGAQLG